MRGQFFDDVGLDSYKVFTGDVQERTATLNRLADAIDTAHKLLTERRLNAKDYTYKRLR